MPHGASRENMNENYTGRWDPMTLRCDTTTNEGNDFIVCTRCNKIIDECLRMLQSNAFPSAMMKEVEQMSGWGRRKDAERDDVETKIRRSSVEQVACPQEKEEGKVVCSLRQGDGGSSGERAGREVAPDHMWALTGAGRELRSADAPRGVLASAGACIEQPLRRLPLVLFPSSPATTTPAYA
jgi:hypothetical protein